MRRPHKTQQLVGLDIEAGSVAATEVSTNGSVQILRTAVERLEPGAWSEGEVADPAELSKALARTFDEHGLSKRVRVGLANQSIAVRLISLPEIEDPDEIATAIRFQAQDHIPMPLDEAVIDWRVVGHRPDDGGRHQLVLVAAARRAMIDRVLEAVRGAGLRPVGVDLAAFGIVRALAGRHSARVADSPEIEPVEGEAPPPAPVLYCHLGDVANFAVARGASCVFTRASTFGMEGIAQRVADRLGCSLVEAREQVGAVGLELPVEQLPGDPAAVATVREVLEEGAHRLADELRMGIEYHSGQAGSEMVSEVVLCGDGSAVPGLGQRLGELLGRPVSVELPEALGPRERAQAARLTLSYGLALEE